MNVTGVNFGSAAAYSISGTVTTGSGSPLANVQITAVGHVAAPRQVLTKADGTYALTGLATDSYLVMPTLAGYTFRPSFRTPTVGPTEGSATGKNFTATTVTAATYPAAVTYSISGTVVTPNAVGLLVPLGGVGITAVGGDGVSHNTTTAGDGTYTLSGLTAKGKYAVWPTLAGYVFNPGFLAPTVGPLAVNVTGVNFTGTATYSISGTVVTGSGSPLANVQITAVGHVAAPRQVLTKADGTYALTGLATDSYLVMPTLAGYTFRPSFRTPQVGPTEGSATGKNFTATTVTAAASLLAAPALDSPEDGAAGLGSSPLLEWDPVDGAAGYSVQVASDKGFTSKVFLGQVTDAQKQLSGLGAGSTYYWRVEAYTKGATSPWSEVWSFTTASK
jgi:hypothetical protein